MIRNNFVFYNDKSTSVFSNELGVGNETGAIVIHVSKLKATATINFSVEGLADLESGTFTQLKVVNLSTFETQTSITAEGLYLVVVSGLYKVRCHSSGSTSGRLKVFANCID